MTKIEKENILQTLTDCGVGITQDTDKIIRWVCDILKSESAIFEKIDILIKRLGCKDQDIIISLLYYEVLNQKAGKKFFGTNIADIEYRLQASTYTDKGSEIPEMVTSLIQEKPNKKALVIQAIDCIYQLHEDIKKFEEENGPEKIEVDPWWIERTNRTKEQLGDDLNNNYSQIARLWLANAIKKISKLETMVKAWKIVVTNRIPDEINTVYFLSKPNAKEKEKHKGRLDQSMSEVKVNSVFYERLQKEKTITIHTPE